LAKLLTESKHRRALIVNSDSYSIHSGIPDDAELTIVSGVDIVNYFQLSRRGVTGLKGELLNPLMYLTIDELNRVQTRSGPMVAMLESQNALHGFKTIFANNLHSLPIVNNLGQVVGNLNASDISGYHATDERLKGSVKDFLLSKQSGKFGTISNTNNLNYAIEYILANNAHRLWVTKDTETLTGCVSTTDILRLVQNY
jgi:CBS-domain-containing membrane protein